MNWTRKCVTRVITLRCGCRQFSQKLIAIKKKIIEKEDPTVIRNIGILAHIDAGKTTTTERMLFFSGSIGHMGEVHHGNTVTDFMDQERERGITITAASVTFQWEKHKINLLDTPGHIDFTMEVEQTLNVMDGAIIILDGSAGVEAQTITVWKQADRYQIPRIVYVNKMDRPDADFLRCQDSIYKQFNITPLLLQLPIYNDSNCFEGIVDLLTLREYKWKSENKFSYSQKVLSQNDGKLWDDAMISRIKLTETLSDLDDKIAEIIIADEKKLETISSSILKDSIRQVTLKQKGVPVLCGSSFKNIGVQCLMDAIIHYLPSPLCLESGKIVQCFGNNLCAKAFKVRHDEHKGPVTFFRIYSGTLQKNQKIYNVKKEKADYCGKLYLAYADDYEEVESVRTGSIAAATGLKITCSGDLISSTSSAFSSAQKALSTKTNKTLNERLLTGGLIPDPVFFCSIEAASQSQQGALDNALSELEREDPSLKVNINNETGQTILGGMGELHLEVIRNRIRNEYKLDVDLGPLQIAYREALVENARDSYNVTHQIGNILNVVKITMSVIKSKEKEKELLLLDRSPECVGNISSIFPKHLLAVKVGVEGALASGPKLLCPVTNVSVMLHSLEVGRGTSDTIITSATIQCIKKLLKKGGTKLLEPIMLIEVVSSNQDLEYIINDLSRRRTKLCSTEARGSDLVIRALSPLSELLGYAKELRILTSGRANFTMEFHSFEEMCSDAEAKAIKSITGF